MDLSKLISELQKCQQKYGDHIEVCIESEGSIFPINTIQEDEDYDKTPYLILDE